jgi:predicted nucleic acid-binding Zn ribbon protein
LYVKKDRKEETFDNMTDIHKHCPICGTPIPLEERVCSQKCQDVLEEQQAKIKKSRRTLTILMIVFIVVFAFIMFFNNLMK